MLACKQSGMMVPTFDLSTQETESQVDPYEFKDILVNMTSSMSARDTE